MKKANRQKDILTLLTALCLSFNLCSCTATASANWSFFQGIKLSSGSASSRVANGRIQLNWERTAENQVKVTGNLDFDLDKVYLRLMRNQGMVHQEIVKPDAERKFSAVLPDPQFADHLCVESDCFDL
ncbi:MAG: hypothetical protein AB7I41_23895 [Candidatus Sericytochromatia bacterium]